jgi:hypothetical protein
MANAMIEVRMIHAPSSDTVLSGRVTRTIPRMKPMSGITGADRYPQTMIALTPRLSDGVVSGGE